MSARAVVYAAPSNVLMTELPDGTGVLLHLDAKSYYVLNATGLVVWKAVSQGARAEDIAERLVAAFEVERAAAARDVEEILDGFVAEGLVAAA